MPMSLLHVDSVSKYFNNKPILSDVYFTCHTNSILALVGRNGSGKSTLLKIIFGSMKAEHKHVKLDDLVIENISSHKGIIQYLNQDSFLPFHSTVSSIIKVFLSPSGRKQITQDKYLSHITKKKVKDLSFGERRLLEIALLIHSDAKFLLLDEPFNGLSPIFKDHIGNMLLQNSTGKGVIITDHDFRNVQEVASSFVIVHEGVVRELKKKEELLKYDYLSADMASFLDKN